MRKKIEAKLHLDGVECTHIYFKNQLQHVRRAQFRKLRMHVGYKLIQLLRIRCNLPSGCSYVLFGDDSEDDALTYSLFLDICARNVAGRPLVYLLRDLGLDRQEALTIGRWQRDVPEGNPVKQVYINLITRTEPRYYEKFGPLFTPTRTSIQVAVSEYAYGRLSREGVSAVAYDMHKKYGVSTYTLRKSIEELFSRKAFPDFSFQELWEHLLKQELLDEKPAGVVPAPSEELSYFRDPIHAANEHLRIRMKYYEEMT
jgi:hypothetical protein